MTDLEPCPFCGNRTPARHARADLAAADLYEVWCRDCGARAGREARRSHPTLERPQAGRSRRSERRHGGGSLIS